MRNREWKVFQDDISSGARSRLKLIADDYCSQGPDQFHKTDFRYLGRMSYDRVTVSLAEFKAWQVRLFGFANDHGGVRTFYVTGIDPAKKQDKGNKNKIEAALKEAVRVTKMLAKPAERKM